tara:strand:+ start:1467 stop:1703 length:237 start_codon:yes stop_codon:yes gene_type:complete
MSDPITTEIDCRRLLCPMPVIRVQDAIKLLSPGDHLRAICTDPGVRSDIPAWCRINGHEVVSIIDQDSEIVVTIVVIA